ncbi:MAG: thioredoxin domain-containing protein [bacterium]
MANSNSLIRDSNPRAGKSTSSLKLIYIFDLQCPACSISNIAMNKIVDIYKDRIEIIYKNFPLPIHPQAKPAAYAAQALYIQKPDKFVEFKDKVYQQQANLSPEVLENMAKSFNLDMDKWSVNKNSKQVQDFVSRDVSDLSQPNLPTSSYETGNNRIQATPSFILLKDDKVIT